MLVIYAGLVGLAAWQFNRAPTGFIPPQDEGYLITIVQLPPGSSLSRTDAVVREATRIMLQTPGIKAESLVLDRDLEPDTVYIGNPRDHKLRRGEGPLSVWRTS